MKSYRLITVILQSFVLMVRKMMAAASLICKGETLNSPPADRWLSQRRSLSLKLLSLERKPTAPACSHVANPSIIKRLLFSFDMATATLIDYTPPSEHFFLRFAFSLLPGMFAFHLSLWLFVRYHHHHHHHRHHHLLLPHRHSFTQTLESIIRKLSFCVMRFFNFTAHSFYWFYCPLSSL